MSLLIFQVFQFSSVFYLFSSVFLLFVPFLSFFRFFLFFPFLSVSFLFFPVLLFFRVPISIFCPFPVLSFFFFRFLPFFRFLLFSVFFFFLFSVLFFFSVFFFSVSPPDKKRGETVCETPFAKPQMAVRPPPSKFLGRQHELNARGGGSSPRKLPLEGLDFQIVLEPHRMARFFRNAYQNKTCVPGGKTREVTSMNTCCLETSPII